MSQQPKKNKKQSRRQTFGSRRLWIVFAFVAAAIGIVFGGGVTKLQHMRISKALSDRNYEQAEEIIQQTYWLKCDTAETAFWDARLRRKLLRVDEVAPLLATAGDLGFDKERIRRELLLLQSQAGQIRSIVDQMNRLVQDPGNDGAEVCEAYVNGALIAGSPKTAELIIPVWKADFPNDPQPFYANARLLEYNAQTDMAETELLAAIRIDNNHWPALYSLGRMYLSQNKVQESLKYFQMASKMRDNAAPLYQTARCLRSLAKPDEAREILVDLLKLPEDSIRKSFARVGEPLHGRPIELELGTVESTLRNFDDAVRWLDIVLESDPGNLDARYARAVALRTLGRVEEADSDFAEVQRVRTLLLEVDRLVDEISQAPNQLHLDKRCRIGELFIKHEDARRGEFWLRETLNLDPNYAPAHRLLAEYYSERAESDPAYTQLAEQHQNAAGIE